MIGTLVENNLAELWSQFDFLMPGFLGPKDRFSKYYRTPIERHGDNDRRNQQARRVPPFMLCRTKDLVTTDAQGAGSVVWATAGFRVRELRK